MHVLHDKLAADLHDYMKSRAAKEGVAYDLSAEFFRGPMIAGVRHYFGVSVGRNKLLRDEQAPAIFAEWKRQQDRAAA
jgi:hypothetical protein